MTGYDPENIAPGSSASNGTVFPVVSVTEIIIPRFPTNTVGVVNVISTIVGVPPLGTHTIAPASIVPSS